jgi:hypothetical protein
MHFPSLFVTEFFLVSCCSCTALVCNEKEVGRGFGGISNSFAPPRGAGGGAGFNSDGGTFGVGSAAESWSSGLHGGEGQCRGGFGGGGGATGGSVCCSTYDPAAGGGGGYSGVFGEFDTLVMSLLTKEIEPIEVSIQGFFQKFATCRKLDVEAVVVGSRIGTLRERVHPRLQFHETL